MHLLESEVYRSSLEKLCTSLDLALLRGQAVLITGASGMLGSCLVDLLSVWNQKQDSPCRIMALSRSLGAAKQRFAPVWNEDFFSFWEQDVCDRPDSLPQHVDYIIHAAGNADPVSMAEYPVDTLMANVLGTKNLMDYGLSHGIKRFLYVSSGEVYGQSDGPDFTEEYCGPLDLSSPRSCYPEGKRAAEVLCQSYIVQHGADVVIARPCHLFGPTMTARDSRAVSEFLRKAVVGENIQLKSAGTLERSHCYTLDAVKAILLMLSVGECGQAYNIADRRYQMTVRRFAERAAEVGECRVIYTEPSRLEAEGYSRANRMVLDAARVEALGWKPDRRDTDAIQETVDILRKGEKWKRNQK